MRFLFAYDLPATRGGDRRRARLARYLEGLGLRVQYSIFELEMAPEEMVRIFRQVEERLDLSEDSLRVYCLCSNCTKKTVRIGVQAPCEHAPVLFF